MIVIDVEMEAARDNGGAVPLSAWDTSNTWKDWLATCGEGMSRETIDPSPRISVVTTTLENILWHI